VVRRGVDGLNFWAEGAAPGLSIKIDLVSGLGGTGLNLYVHVDLGPAHGKDSQDISTSPTSKPQKNSKNHHHIY